MLQSQQPAWLAAWIIPHADFLDAAMPSPYHVRMNEQSKDRDQREKLRLSQLSHGAG
jgi:hypothetical protein